MMRACGRSGETTEGVESTLQVVTAQRIAQATVTGFGFCEECGHPLTERQKVALLTAAMLEVDGLHEEVRGRRARGAARSPSFAASTDRRIAERARAADAMRLDREIARHPSSDRRMRGSA